MNKRIKVWWPNDEEWYAGSIESYDSKTGKHTIRYDDNELECVNLRDEKVIIV